MPSGRQKDKVSSIVNATIRQVGSDLIAVRRGLQKSNLAIEDLHIIYIYMWGGFHKWGPNGWIVTGKSDSNG
jgi:hypothetical protein